MPIYEYRVRGSRLSARVGTISADSPRTARDQLRLQGIEIDSMKCIDHLERGSEKASQSTANASVRSVVGSLYQGTIRRWRGHRLVHQVTWFTRELATLLRVGTPVVDALDLTIAQSNAKMRPWLLRVRRDLQSGRSLSESLANCSGVFGHVLIELVGVGERSGTLPLILHQAAEFQDRKDRLRDRVLSALLYPSLVLALSICVTLFLMTVVVPMLLDSLQEFGQELPWPTKLLKFVSDSLIQYYPMLLLILILSIVLIVAGLSTVRGMRLLQGIALKIPLLRTLIIKQNCSRLCMVTGTLLASGVELIRALEIAQESISNLHIRDAIDSARQRIRSGSEIGAAVAESSVLPLGLVQVFSLGQNSGELDKLLLQISEDYDAQVRSITDRLATILEPALIVCLSVIVGFILIATLLPILETGNVLSEQ